VVAKRDCGFGSQSFVTKCNYDFVLDAAGIKIDMGGDVLEVIACEAMCWGRRNRVGPLCRRLSKYRPVGRH